MGNQSKQLHIRSHSIFGTHHSWAVTMRSLFKEIIGLGHEPYLLSINKWENTPDEWESYRNRHIEEPDIDFCYTAPINFGKRFAKKAKVKAAIYNYETVPLPKVFAGAHKHVDYVLPSSNFSKEVFLEAGWPEEKLLVVPHGVRKEDFLDKRKIRLKNDKSFRFLNVSIAHYRKNIPLLVAAYYDAFTSLDDVCLVIKTQVTPSPSKKRNRFEQLIAKDIALLQDSLIRKGRPASSLPIIELIEEKFDSLIPLYNSCDAIVSATSTEGFGIPLLEGLAANKIVIAPRCTGQLDFLNDKNSLLVDVAKMKASPQYQYWEVSDKAWTYIPIKKSLSMNMRAAFDNHLLLKAKFEPAMKETVDVFTWKNAAKKILELA